MSCGLCGKSSCSCTVNPTALLPHYNNPCNVCEEDSTKYIYIHRYTAAIKIMNEWITPAEGQIAVLQVPALVDMVVGASLWHPQYGYYLIIAFDAERQLLQIRNDRANTNAAPGSRVPSCTNFLLTVTP